MATGDEPQQQPAQEPTSVNSPQASNANASNVHSSQSSQKECTEGSSAVRGKTDPAWEHFAYKKDGRTNVYTCLHCGATYRGGGINRMKQHLAGIPGQIAKCKKVPHDVRHRMLESLKEIQEKKQNEDLNEAYDDQLVDPGVQANPTGSNEMQSAPQNKGELLIATI
ncbi:Zinc finger, BED-type [Sesbania bispinosa]|nr:Zinc finger, BED-type [Sesbania bispinosa]